MTDIAEIGFRADTSDLDKAVLTLNKLKNASKGVATSTNQVARSVQGSSKAMVAANLEVARASTAKARATLSAATASGTASKAQMQQARAALKTATAEENAARSIMATAKANDALKRATVSATQAQVKQMTVMQRINKTTGVSSAGSHSITGAGSGSFIANKSARESAGAFGGMANDQMPNRFNTANIAAQFQDIGVTAAMGMNPLTIALQQGTQLSAILNSMESPLAGLAQAFKSIINPVSLMAIAFTAILVTMIQLVDWTEFAKGALMGLANVIESVGPSVLALAAIFAVLYSPAIITGLFTVVATVSKIGFAALVAGGKMAAAWIIAGGPILWLAAGIATILGLLVIFKDEIANLIGVDVIGKITSGVNRIIGLFVGAKNVVIAVWKLLPGGIKNIMLGVVNEVIIGTERAVNKVIEILNKMPGVDIEFRADGKGIKNIPDEAKIAGEAIAAAMAEGLNGKYVESVGNAVKGIAGKVRGFASGIGSEEDKQVENYAKVVAGAKRRIATLEAEQKALGLTAEAAAKLKNEQDLINKATQQGIELSPTQRRELEGLAGTMAKLEIETKRAKDSMDFAKSSANGFISDLRSGLKEGEGLWASFANAVSNALNKILDKMIETNINKLFEDSSGDSGGGIFGAIASIAGGLFGGGNLSSGASVQASGIVPTARPFAKGGTFTNGVYSKPTPFKFANGGEFGEMGEAGPEAVMPLHRGSDGSLGVKMSGGTGGGEGDVVNNYTIDARGADVGVEQRIRNVMAQLEQLRKDTPKIAISSVQDANSRNLGFFG